MYLALRTHLEALAGDHSYIPLTKDYCSPLLGMVILFDQKLQFQEETYLEQRRGKETPT